MLDALVTEARLRFGLDPATGLQIVAVERLISTPFEASRPVLLVPLAVLQPGAVAERRAATARPARSARADRARRPRARLSGRSPGRAVRHARRPPRSARSRDDDLVAPLYLAPLAPEAAVAGPWAMPGHQRPPARPGRLPVGPRADPPVAAQATCSRRPTRSTTRSRRAPRRSWPASSATCCSRSCSTRSSPPRPACSTWPTSRRRSRPRSCAATRTCSARPRRGPRPTSTASGSGSRPPSGPRARRRWHRDRTRRARRHLRVAAGARRQPGDAGAGRQPRLRLAVDRRRARQGHRGDRGAARGRRGRRGPGAWAEEFGDLLFVLVNVARKRGIEAEAALRAANAKFRRRFGQRGARWPPIAASRCATWTSPRSTSCGTPPRRRRGSRT